MCIRDRDTRTSDVTAKSNDGNDDKPGTITITSNASISPASGSLGSFKGVPEELKKFFPKGEVSNDELALGRGIEQAKDMVEEVYKDFILSLEDEYYYLGQDFAKRFLIVNG